MASALQVCLHYFTFARQNITPSDFSAFVHISSEELYSFVEYYFGSRYFQYTEDDCYFSFIYSFVLNLLLARDYLPQRNSLSFRASRELFHGPSVSDHPSGAYQFLMRNLSNPIIKRMLVYGLYSRLYEMQDRSFLDINSGEGSLLSARNYLKQYLHYQNL